MPSIKTKPLPTLWDIRRSMAVWWARRRGIRCNRGGWLYLPLRHKAVAQGYGALYERYKREIWAEFDAWTKDEIK